MLQRGMLTDGDGNFAFTAKEDCSATFDETKRMAQTGLYKKEWGQAICNIPFSVVEKIKNDFGVDMFDLNDRPKFMVILRRDYPHFFIKEHL